MTDIVERLRGIAICKSDLYDKKLLYEAADDIERLRTTVNDQAATITGLLREIDRLLLQVKVAERLIPTPPITRHDTDKQP